MTHYRTIALLTVIACLTGCATYTTPGGGADLAGIQGDGDIGELMSREPAATFPAIATIVRVQAPQYVSMTADTYGDGAYSVVTNRELLTEEVVAKIGKAQGVKGLSLLNRLLLPTRFSSIDDLRTASARLKADILIVYTLDTSFRVDGKSIGPLSVISLGLMRDRETVVNTTASAMLVDVRTGFVFGTAESTATQTQVTNAWGSVNAADRGRIDTEQASFALLVDELESLWADIVEKHGE